MVSRSWNLPIRNIYRFFILYHLSLYLRAVGMKWWLSVPLKIIYVFWVVHYVFFDKVLFSKETVASYFVISFLTNDYCQRNWEGITNPFRTILFFILLWMTTYLIRHWIETRKSIFLFYIMTVVFIAFMDTFSAYSAEALF